MGRTNTINYALAATLVASGVTLEQAAIKTGAKTADSLRVGLARRNVTVTAIRNSEGNIDRLTNVANRLVSQASEALRSDFANELARTTAQLKTIKPGKSLKLLRQRAEVLEPLARTAKIVHDWGNETSQGIIAFGVVEQLDQAQDAIEVSSSVSDTPSNSVPSNPPDSTTTLDTEQPS